MKSTAEILAEIEAIDVRLDELAQQRSKLSKRRKNQGLVSLEKSLQREVQEFLSRKSSWRG